MQSRRWGQLVKARICRKTKLAAAALPLCCAQITLLGGVGASLRMMAASHWSGLEQGGTLWFHDLTQVNYLSVSCLRAEAIGLTPCWERHHIFQPTCMQRGYWVGSLSGSGLDGSTAGSCVTQLCDGSLSCVTQLCDSVV